LPIGIEVGIVAHEVFVVATQAGVIMQIAEFECIAGLRIAECLHVANELVLAESRLSRTAHGIGSHVGVRDMLR
jgi:hypothetical protein